MNLQGMDRKYLARDEAPPPIEIVRSKGDFLYSAKGKKYIDFTMGWCVGNLGWSVPEIQSKLKRFKGPDYVQPTFLYRRWADLAKHLAEITPGRLQKCFRATGGTEAVDFALTAAMTYTKRDQFISVEEAYHGDSFAAREVGSPPFGKWYHHRLLGSWRMKPPFDIREARRVEKRLAKRDVAAVILEPIICNLNVQIPEIEFMDHLQAACKKYGTLLIVDEVASGFMRTGKMFASEHYGLQPDILCLAKSLTSGAEGMGATIVTPEIADAVQEQGHYHSTYGWHPRAVEAAIATVEYYRKHQARLERRVHAMGEYFEERLRKIRFRYQGHLRCLGLAIGVEFEKKHYGETLAERCQESGLLISGNEDGFTLFPSLNISRATAKRGLDILESRAFD